jgi:hypothetical protein
LESGIWPHVRRIDWNQRAVFNPPAPQKDCFESTRFGPLNHIYISALTWYGRDALATPFYTKATIELSKSRKKVLFVVIVAARNGDIPGASLLFSLTSSVLESGASSERVTYRSHAIITCARPLCFWRRRRRRGRAVSKGNQRCSFKHTLINRSLK